MYFHYLQHPVKKFDPAKTDLMWFVITYKLVHPIGYIIYFSYKEARSNSLLSATRQPLVLIKQQSSVWLVSIQEIFNKFTKTYILLLVKQCLYRSGSREVKVQEKGVIECTCVFWLVSVMLSCFHTEKWRVGGEDTCLSCCVL